LSEHIKIVLKKEYFTLFFNSLIKTILVTIQACFSPLKKNTLTRELKRSSFLGGPAAAAGWNG